MKKFNWQIFISFNLLFTFLVMFLSGVILYFKPEGSVARWIDWEILFIDKSTWESLHTVFSFLFLAFALLHIIKIHLPNIAFYLHTKSQRTGRELYFSVVISVVFLMGTALTIKPFSYVYEAGNYLSDSWRIISQPPDGIINARTTMKEYSGHRNIQYGALEDSLKALDVSDLSKNKNFQEIGANNNMPPYKLYTLIERINFPVKSSKETPKGDVTVSEIAFLFDQNTQDILDYMNSRYETIDIKTETTLEEMAKATDSSIQDIRQELLRFLKEKEND